MARLRPTCAPGAPPTAAAVVSTPCTSQGCRPISVTYHPASTATQPEKVMSTRGRASAGEGSWPRRRRQAANQETASISTPTPTMRRKAQNTGATGG